LEGAIDIVMPASTGALAHGVACLALAALVAGTRRNLGVAHGGAEPSGSHALDAEERNVRALLRSYLTCYRTTHEPWRWSVAPVLHAAGLQPRNTSLHKWVDYELGWAKTQQCLL
jgi:hypothetical protein